jgi:hypothetical protein
MIPGTHWTGVWVCPSVSSDAFQKIPHPLLGIKPWFWGHSAQTLVSTSNELLHLPPNGVFYTVAILGLVSSVTKCIHCMDIAVFVCGALSILWWCQKWRWNYKTSHIFEDKWWNVIFFLCFIHDEVACLNCIMVSICAKKLVCTIITKLYAKWSFMFLTGS